VPRGLVTSDFPYGVNDLLRRYLRDVESHIIIQSQRQNFSAWCHQTLRQRRFPCQFDLGCLPSTDVLSVLRRKAITPSIFTAESITIESEKRGKHGRPFLKIPVEVLEKL